MEQIKAPEKIYIPTILAANAVRYKENGSIEYVRTDAFIHKALEWIGENIRPYYHEVRYKYEDFEKYIRGE